MITRMFSNARLRTASLAAVALVASVATTPAMATISFINATLDTGLESSFTLDFLGADFGDGLSSVRSGLITTHHMGLALDDVAGTALLNYYDQDVDPIVLPTGINTGPITVGVVPGTQSSVSFSPLGGNVYAFETSEFYEIGFTADLSAFGISGTSAFLPGGAIGVIDYDNQTISMAWSGSGVLLHPTIQGQFIPFQYECAVNAVFPEPASLALMAAGVLAISRRRNRA